MSVEMLTTYKALKEKGVSRTVKVDMFIVCLKTHTNTHVININFQNFQLIMLYVCFCFVVAVVVAAFVY